MAETGENFSQEEQTSLQQEERQPTSACTSCSQRKVKCDRQQPCSSCSKIRARCIYKAPAPPQRRKRKTEVAIMTRLREYEQTLDLNGLLSQPFHAADPADVSPGRGARSSTIESSAARAPPTPASLGERDRPAFQWRKPQGGTLVGERYYDHQLLASLSEEFKKDPVDMAQYDVQPAEEDSETSINFAAGLVMGLSARQFQQRPDPSSSELLQLWSIFLENVNPLTKIIHVPSMQQLLGDAVTSWGSISKSTEALILSVCACAVASMSEIDCQRTFGQPQRNMLSSYQREAQRLLLDTLLINTSDMMMLQAYTFLLTSMQHDYHPRSFWIQVGVAIRIGQSLGLHRDGAILGLKPFDAEMRRRLWWCIIMLDTRATELGGVGTSMMPLFADTALPANVNDVDIEPHMVLPPVGRVGPTEMMYCLLHYEITRFIQRNRHLKGAGGLQLRSPDGFSLDGMETSSFRPQTQNAGPQSAQPNSRRSFSRSEGGLADGSFSQGNDGSSSRMDDIDPRHSIDGGNGRSSRGSFAQPGAAEPLPDGRRRHLKDFESLIESKFLRFTDPCHPLHVLTTITARAAICRLEHRRCMARRAKILADKSWSISREERDIALSYSAKIIEYDNLLHQTRSTRRFLWHLQNYFPWGPLIELLKELVVRAESSEDLSNLWQQVEEMYEHHPEYMSMDSRNAMHVIIGDLTLKAWAIQETTMSQNGQRIGYVPSFIGQLRLRQDTFSTNYQQGETNAQFNYGGNQVMNTGTSEWEIGLGWDSAFESGGSLPPAPMDWSVWMGNGP